MYHELTMFVQDKKATFNGYLRSSEHGYVTHCIHLDTRFDNVHWQETDIRLFLETENIAPMLAALDDICAAMRLYLYNNAAPAAGIQEEWRGVK